MSGMYHDFGAIPNRKGSRQSEVSESQERSRPSSRRLGRLSSTANTEDRTNSSAGTPQPEGSSKRIRQKRKEYSPEVEEKKKPAIVLTKRAPRKSGSTVPSTPKEQSPPQELGKRETRKKSRFSPSPQSSSKPVKEAEEVEERFLLSMISDALKNLPEVDYDLPKDIKVWAKRRANATARKAVSETAKKAVNVNPSTPDEVEADETFEEAQLQQVRILFDDERPIHEHLFEQIPVKVEEPDDYETAGPSNNVLEEELEDIKPVIAAEPEVPVPVETPAPKKRKAPVSSGKKGKQATPDKEPVPKRSKRGQKEPSPAEEPKQEEVEGRRSRRSTAGFKELMAGLVSGSRPKSTPKLKTEIPKAAIKKKVEEKEETPVSEKVSPEPEPVDAKIETDTPKTKKSKKEKTPEPSPEPVAPIRRSSRSTVPSSKLPESGKKDVEFKVKPKPGSALEILKKTSRYQRVQRSPTPETPTPSPAPSKTSGSSSVPITPEKVVQNEAPAVEVKPVEEEAVPVPENIGNDQESEKKMKRRSERNRDLEERLDQMIKNTFTENADYSEETFEPEEEVPIEQWSPDSSPTTFDSPRGTIKLVSKKKKKCATKEKTPEKQIPSPANVATRRSSRAFKPKISDEDFVFEVPVVIRKEIEASPSKKSPLKSPSPVKKEMRLRSSSLTSPPKEDEETAAEKTRKYVEEHKGPIKLSFKIGSEVATVVKTGEEEVETEASTPTEEEELIEDVPTEEEEMIKIPSAPAHRKRKEPHWWNLYTPTPKPVLENFTRPDGTIEHLGVVINSVMDALLLKVCDDGIRRHSNKMAKEARKAEMSEMAKKRYYEKKRIAEERQARGEPALPFPVKKTSAELFAHTISTRERTKKGALYKNNEYLLKPVKLQREADMEREHREQEARDYLNRQFMREAEEDLKREARGKGRMTKAVKHVSFKDFTDTKGGATTQVLRPTTTNPDFFHREILREPEELTMVPESDEVSVDDEEDMPQNLCSTAFIDQAKTTSDQICNLFVRDPNVTSYTDMLGRLIEEPEIRQAIIANAIEVLIDFQQVKFGTEFSPNAHVILHNEATTRAYDLRDSFSLGHAEKETMCWAHGFMIQNLPADYLPGYLILLRYWKHHNGSAVASFAKKPIQEEVYPWAEVTELIWSYILNKVVDPDRENLQATIDTEVLSDVIFVLVPPAFQYGEYSSSSKAHENIYRWLKMMGSKESYIMKMDYECRPNESVYEAIEFYTTVLKNDLSKLVREMRNKRIVLVGWGLTAYMCHRVVQLTHGVSAIIDLAFPLRSVHGYRGGPDDDILLTYCPSLFVVGAQDKLFSAVALKELRTGMQTETGAVVIHYADSNLYVPSHLLNRHNITQRTVSRSILEYIVDFLKLPCTKKERSQLIQADLNAVYTVEVDSLKAIVGGAPTAPQRVQKHATIDGGKPPSAPRQRKRKADFSLPPSLLATPQAMPALLAEVNASGTTAEARYRFDEIVRSARTGGTTSDVLSPTPRTAPVTFTSSPLPSPSIRPASHQNPLFPLRGPPLPSPLARTAPMEPSGHLLNPANISLS